VTEVEVQGVVGPQVLADGVPATERLGRSGEQVVQELHGRFFETNYRAALYSGGMGLTSINNVTFTTGTLGATVTPICGVYNPIGSAFNLVILQAVLGITVTAGTGTGGGPFVWATAITTAPISTGNNPLNRKTLQPSGSVAKDLTNVAPTGMTPNLAVRFASALTGGLLKNVSSVETAVGQNIGTAGVTVENIDGGIIVPPGGVLALLATTTPVAHSATSALLWEEVAV
jgi:hypothetical protein